METLKEKVVIVLIALNVPQIYGSQRFSCTSSIFFIESTVSAPA